MEVKKNDVLLVIALICALWFAVLAWVWVYWAALFVAYPVGLVSLLLWLNLRKENKARTKFIPIVLVVGLTLSVGMLVYLTLFE
jgi:FtsH-binding integral membrane protein